MGIKVEERSLQLALVKAAGQLGVTQDLLGYKVISEKNGFLGLFGRKILIEAWAKNPMRVAKNHQKNNSRKAGFYDENRNDKEEKKDDRSTKRSFGREEIALRIDQPPLAKEELSLLKNQLTDFCSKLCAMMSDDLVKVQCIEEETRLILDIESEFLSGQALKNPKLAESLEHLLRRAPKDLKQDLPFRLFVDFFGARRHRENELIDMAQDLSNQVFQNKKPVVLNYKSSYDRKIIHMALDKDTRVYTKSIGSGANRKLMILPAQ